MNIVSNAIKYYDKQREIYKKFYTSDYTFKFKSSSKSEIKIPEFEFIYNKKIIATGKCNIIGVYFHDDKIWSWGWNISWNDYGIKGSTKNETYMARKLLNYGLDMGINEKITTNDKIAINEMRSELLSNKIFITHPIQFEKILAISLYLTNGLFIYKSDEKYTNATRYFIISEIDYI
jgi:hypothetical protein